MGIKEHIKNKKSKKQNEPDIVDTLSSTIDQLQTYLNKLNNGQVHNIERYEGSRNAEFAQILIKKEIEIVSEAIPTLAVVKETIVRGRIAENHFHYDLDGRSMGEEE